MREILGPVGVWVSASALEPDPGELAARVERLGYGALWLGGGNPDGAAFDLIDRALAGSSDVVLATGIANVWAWEPVALAGRVAALEAAHPGRFVLGLGVSHAPLVEQLGRRYERPYRAMVDFLDAFEVAVTGSAAEATPVVLAALGDRMLGLARDRTAGAHPYFVPPEHTAHARLVLGDEPVLAPEQALVVDADAERARATARTYGARYLGMPNYTGNLARLGYGADELAGSGSDRLLDAIVPQGTADVVATAVRAQLAAGADHVCVQPLAAGGGPDLAALEALAPLLIGA